jgi:peptidoglycan/xylan/chitin deacetylase (PgdA/CDA1 family)
MSGILARREDAASRDLTVLTYHRVLPETRCAGYPFPSLVMPVGAFHAQVRWLVAHGEVLPLSKALERRVDDSRARRRVFALTFDDGYHDASDVAAAVLEDAGVRGTFFVTTGFVGTNELLWFDRAALLFAAVDERTRRAIVERICGEGGPIVHPPVGADGASWTRHIKGCRPEVRASILTELERAAGGALSADGFGSLSVTQLVQMHRRGHEIGSHTVSHTMLPGLDEASLRSELEKARDSISGWIGGDVLGFCYPNGDHDQRSAAAVARAGHAYACTTRDGTHAPGGDLFRIPRVDVAPLRVLDGGRRLDVTAFRRELCGLYRHRGRVAAHRDAR